ncbi:NADP-dependent oxidoreductase [Sphingomonas mali]|uniref:NADP-dependent oxidoreductase n=1 Tax=Sphingomonas mali TaxID=40682 RepID=UPI0008309D53|nr:NADP-dependent oxidoreductase [Sphingomonas mali]
MASTDGTPMINRQWLLARRPRGRLQLADFAYRAGPYEPPPLGEGEILLRNRLFRFSPAMRGWMKTTAQNVAPMAVGEPVLGNTTAEVIASRAPAYPVGAIVSTLASWQDYQVIDPAAAAIPPRIKPVDVTLHDFEGVFGTNSLTAYFGLLRIGEPRPGDTVLVSGAAGSTGSVAAQIARICGCRVIGLAGGPEKCAWLRDVCGLDAAIDYKNEDVGERLAALCPDGIQVFFDNVGGRLLDIAIDHMARFGRIVLCGQIASYDDGDALAPGPRNMMRVVYWRLRLQGFIVFDFIDAVPEALADLRRWHADGRLVHRSELVVGFKRLPESFLRIFDGSSRGTLLLEAD